MMSRPIISLINWNEMLSIKFWINDKNPLYKTVTRMQNLYSYP